MVSCWEDFLGNKVRAGLLKFKAAASTPGGHGGPLLSLRALEVNTGDVWSTLTGKKIREVPNISFWFSLSHTQACSLHSRVPTYMPMCKCTHIYTYTTYTYTCKIYLDEHTHMSRFMKYILYCSTAVFYLLVFIVIPLKSDCHQHLRTYSVYLKRCVEERRSFPDTLELCTPRA